MTSPALPEDGPALMKRAARIGYGKAQIARDCGLDVHAVGRVGKPGERVLKRTFNKVRDAIVARERQVLAHLAGIDPDAVIEAAETVLSEASRDFAERRRERFDAGETLHLNLKGAA